MIEPSIRSRGYDHKENLRRLFRILVHFDSALFIRLVALSVTLLLGVLGCGKSNSRDVVVIYAAQDQVYAEPILRAFEKETGIKVKAVFDSEAVKTVGLANRLLAEREQPRVHPVLQGGALAHQEQPPAGTLAFLALLERRQRRGSAVSRAGARDASTARAVRARSYSDRGRATERFFAASSE